MLIAICGFIFSFFVAFLAYKKGSLSLSGLVSAIILGTFLYYFGGAFFFAIMISFFISSSILTKFKTKSKNNLEDLNEKGGRRDFLQVLANGGLGLIFSLLYYMTKEPLYMVAFATAFASANADTWASELGVLSSRKPISIINFKPSERGISGAISAFGTMASFLGSLFIALVFFVGSLLNYTTDSSIYKYLIIITLCGFMGSIFDSYLGALIQAKYKCQVCSKVTEKKHHHGKATILIKGLHWFNNDLVNFTSGFLSSLLAIGLFSTYIK